MAQQIDQYDRSVASACQVGPDYVLEFLDGGLQLRFVPYRSRCQLGYSHAGDQSGLTVRVANIVEVVVKDPKQIIKVRQRGAGFLGAEGTKVERVEWGGTDASVGSREEITQRLAQRRSRYETDRQIADNAQSNKS